MKKIDLFHTEELEKRKINKLKFFIEKIKNG